MPGVGSPRSQSRGRKFKWPTKNLPGAMALSIPIKDIMDEFPPNSKKAKEGVREGPRVERVTSADAVRRKKPLGKQFKETFFGSDGRTTMNYVVTQVLIPMIQDTFIEVVQSGIERLVRGEHRTGRRRGGPPSGPHGTVAYHRMSGGAYDDRPPMARGVSRRARARNDFDEIILDSRSEAEEVIDRLYEVISRYDEASVADLYELTGIESSHTDHKWGWTDMRGASVTRLRSGGYLLNLPEPESLN